MDVDNKKVGFRIKSIRQKLGKTTKEFGSLVDGASDSLVSRWERGVNLPNVLRLTIIARLGDISLTELLYGPFDDYARNFIERLTYDPEDAFMYGLSDENRKMIIDKTMNQVKKKGHAKYFYAIGEIDAARNKIISEFSDTGMRKIMGTEFTNKGALNNISMGISELMRELEEYQNNGVDTDIYSDIENIIEIANDSLNALYAKYRDRLKK